MAKIKVSDRELYYDTTDDFTYELRPDGVYQVVGVRGADRVLPSGPAGVSATSGGYDADKSVTTSSQREAIPSGASAVWVRNNDATNFMRFRFGDSTVTATGTTGFRINANEVVQVPVPPDATHWAYIADTATVTASVVWG